jgi:hypothetical protein
LSTSSTYISPQYQVSDWTRLDFTKKSDWTKAVAILHDRIEGRFLRMVENIEDDKFSGFAALALDCLLIETLQQFKQGVDGTPRYKGGTYFEDFLTKTSFGNHFTKATAGMFYDQFRCGILHQAEIKGSSKVWKVGDLVRVTSDEKGLVVNHKKFHAELRRVFATYLKELRAGTDRTLRENFKKKMAFICQA